MQLLMQQTTNHINKLMKLTAYKTLGLAGTLALAALPALADHNTPEDSLFRAHETSLDLFGSVSVGQETINHISKDRVRDNGRVGAGIGLNYFFDRYVGIGGDAYTENAGHSFVDSASANLILRIPIDSIHLAPYAYGGGGYEFDARELWFGQAGAGVELRFTKKFGIFADARYVFTEGAKDYGVGRVGLRLSF